LKRCGAAIGRIAYTTLYYNVDFEVLRIKLGIRKEELGKDTYIYIYIEMK
jgi:hypothetical protein